MSNYSADTLLQILKQDYEQYISYASELNKKCMGLQRDDRHHDNDIRENIYKQLYKVIWPYSVGLKFLVTELFYNQRCFVQFPGISETTRAETIQYYELLLRNGLIFCSSSVSESGVRAFFRSFFPERKGVGKFQSRILTPLFEKLKISMESEEVKALLLLAEVRNCIHNNGAYVSPEQKDSRITYRGKEHLFVHGESHGSASRRLLLSIISDIESLFDLIITRDDVKSKKYIPDVISGLLRNDDSIVDPK